MNYINFIKKGFYPFLIVHGLFLLISMLRHGISITYFELFFLSVLLLSGAVYYFIYSRILKNSYSLGHFILLFLNLIVKTLAKDRRCRNK
jgi:hypothetical protein